MRDDLALGSGVAGEKAAVVVRLWWGGTRERRLWVVVPQRSTRFASVVLEFVSPRASLHYLARY